MYSCGIWIQGAHYLYTNLLRPVLLKHQRSLDRVVDGTRNEMVRNYSVFVWFCLHMLHFLPHLVCPSKVNQWMCKTFHNLGLFLVPLKHMQFHALGDFCFRSFWSVQRVQFLCTFIFVTNAIQRQGHSRLAGMCVHMCL